MNDAHLQHDQGEIYSKSLRAGRRTYFFDVRETRAGDYYLTVTESKKTQIDENNFSYKKHKIYLYKEDFSKFMEILEDCTSYITETKGDEVISERHKSDFDTDSATPPKDTSGFSDLNFEDI